MKDDIEKYRSQNYPGIIQAVKIRVGEESWFYDPSRTVTEDIAWRNFENVSLSGIVHCADSDNKLDVTELVFSETRTGTPEIANRYPQVQVERREPYFKKIRKYIGQDYLFSCGMTVIIENDKNEVALGRRSDANRWAFPAGAKEIHESIEDTVHNETMEELGIEIHPPRLMAVFSGEKCKTSYPNGDKMHYLTFLFKAKHKNETLHVNDAENSQVAWIHRDRLFDMVTERLFKRESIYNSFNGQVFVDRFE